MGKKLVIVESPTKANTISRFLGSDYQVDSSFGHIRDLPKSQLGVDVEHDFEPKYVIPKASQKQVTKLKKEAEKAEEVILATDEDREGEAIAWHLVEALKLRDKLTTGKVKRIVFHEITENAIEEAIKKPRQIDENMVNAQQARRVLDRLVGYKLSPLLWKKVMRGLSAGRVQSVAVRLIVEREEEIRNFKPVTYYTISAELKITGKDGEVETITFGLIKISGKALPKPGLTDKEAVEKIVAELRNGKYRIESIKEKEVKKRPLPPFITSTLQQTAANRLGYSAKKTMMLAQRLYEQGHITYMRTDSVNLSKEALIGAQKYLKENLGEKYALATPRRFSQKSKLAQEAHEAIRPTKPKVAREDLSLEAGEAKIYDLIWRRFIASQMPEALFKATIIDIEAQGEGKDKYLLRANGNVVKFDGFLKIWPTQLKETILPEVAEADQVEPVKVGAEEHQTEPPARYNEASLVKVLEENGIGRPSTYASIISVIQDRNYVEKNEQKRFQPTEIGEIVNKLLTEHFPKIVDVGFTADVEEEFDEVAVGVTNWREVIRNFYEPFAKRLAEKERELNKQDIVPEEETNEKCEKCGSAMIIKRGRFGKFLACSGFPECKNTKKLEGELAARAGGGGFKSQDTGVKCPECGIGTLVSRRVSKGRARGKIFWGCSRYPECKGATWTKPGTEKTGKNKEK